MRMDLLIQRQKATAVQRQKVTGESVDRSESNKGREVKMGQGQGADILTKIFDRIALTSRLIS